MRYTISILLASLLPLPAAAEVPDVVTDFAPIQSLVAQVMGDVGVPVMLLPAGGDPHDFQLKPSQAQVLADADLVFWDGPELMPSLAEAIASLAPEARSVALLHDGGGRIRQFDDGEGVDSHAWLDPANASAWLGTIAVELSALDRENAAAYAANAATAQASLAVLDAELAARLATVQGVPFVVFHDALGYFVDHYGLNLAGAIELGDASAPSAAQLSRIRALLVDAKAVCVFPEAGRDPKLIEVVAEGSGARIGAAQDIEALALPVGPDLYARLLRDLAKTFTDCLASQG